MIKIVTINGSVRPGNNTGKALAIVEDELRKDGRIEVVRLEPMNHVLPLPGQQGQAAEVDAIQDMVTDAAAVVLSTPEYHGSFSSVLKLVIENLGYPSVLEGKPVALLGVASGAIGAVKSLEHLRSVASHVGCIILPGPVSVAGVHNCFDKEGNCICEETQKRLKRQADNLISFLETHHCPMVALEEMVRGDD